MECLPGNFYRGFTWKRSAREWSGPRFRLEGEGRGGGRAELTRMRFERGCSKDPLDLLRDAGWDMETRRRLARDRWSGSGSGWDDWSGVALNT